MTVQDAVHVGRSIAVMVRIEGPDPKRLKMRNHAFHKYDSGNTTLSASGMVLPHSLYEAESAKRAFGKNEKKLALVITVASVVEPFLSLQHRLNKVKGRPELIPGAKISILMEDNVRVEKNCDADNGAPNWIPSELLAFVDVPEPAHALQSLLHASLSSGGQGWEIGWSLASQTNQPSGELFVAKHPRMAVEESANPITMGKSLTRIAILGVALPLKVLPAITLTSSSMMTRGASLVAVASPFGILSPMHFLNSVTRGSIANYYPPNLPSKLLLMADIRCLPGMEGGPVLDENASLVGVLCRPLNQENSGAEVQLLIPWEAIAIACTHALLNMDQKTGSNHIVIGEKVNCNEMIPDTFGRATVYNKTDIENLATHSHEDPLVCRSPSAHEKAMASVCLVTIDDRLWASGILLNEQGLVLTNAHLLEPWRFGRTHVNGESTEKYPSPFPSTSDEHCEKNSTDPRMPGNNVDTKRSRYKRIRVRLDHTEPWVWCDAKVVYVCKGPLDIALLQLVDAPGQLSPVTVEFKSPPPGSRAYVIGHGLFGPRCGFMPSISSGVVSKVVKVKLPESCSCAIQLDKQGEFPAMLETTAAVHPGASGGVVVNSDGHMIGLITSNARHGGGTTIPHLNFSIPSASLAPVFDFSKDPEKIFVLHDLDQPNQNLSRVWELIPPLSEKRVPPSAAEKDGKRGVGNGSRFAKFVMENNLLKEPTPRVIERRPTLPSKL